MAHPVPTLCHGEGHLPLLHTLSNLALDTAWDWTATASVGKYFVIFNQFFCDKSVVHISYLAKLIRQQKSTKCRF